MAGIDLVPSKNQLEKYLAGGLTQAQVAEQWERDSGVKVTRSAIGMAIIRYGLKSSKPRPRYSNLLPWVVSEVHRHSMDARQLRAEARRRAGNSLTEQEEATLNGWLERLKAAGAVVHYDPDTEDGWHWVVPEEGDDDLIHYPPYDPRSPKYKENGHRG